MPKLAQVFGQQHAQPPSDQLTPEEARQASMVCTAFAYGAGNIDMKWLMNNRKLDPEVLNSAAGKLHKMGKAGPRTT